MIRAGPHAVPAAEAAGVDLADDSGVVSVIRGRCRANGNAWGMTVVADAAAVLAGPWHVNHFGIGKGLIKQC